MVGTMKRCLQKVLGQSKLAEEQLNTTLISSQLEAHHARGEFRSPDSSALPDWRRTYHNTHRTRTHSEAELGHGATIETGTV